MKRLFTSVAGLSMLLALALTTVPISSAQAQLGGLLGGGGGGGGGVGGLIGGGGGSLLPSIGPSIGPSLGVGQTLNGAGSIGPQLGGTLGHASQLTNRTLHQANGVVNHTQQLTNRTVNQVQHVGGRTINQAQGLANQTVNQAQGIANRAVNQVQGVASNTVNHAQGAVNHTVGNVQRTVRQLDVGVNGNVVADTMNTINANGLKSSVDAASQAALGVFLGPDNKISAIVNDSAAALAGLQIGDRILGIEGVRIHTPQMLIDKLQSLVPNQTVQLLVDHNGLTQTVAATLNTREVLNRVDRIAQGATADVNRAIGKVRDTVNSLEVTANAGVDGSYNVGLKGGDLDVGAKIDPNAVLGVNFTNGLTVNGLLTNTFAALKPGDRILSLNGTRIATPHELLNHLRNLDLDQAIDLMVIRNGDLIHVDAMVTVTDLVDRVNQLARNAVDRVNGLRDGVEAKVDGLTAGVNQKVRDTLNKVDDLNVSVDATVNNISVSRSVMADDLTKGVTARVQRTTDAVSNLREKVESKADGLVENVLNKTAP